MDQGNPAHDRPSGQSRLSPDAVEALATAVAAKVAGNIAATTRLTDQMLEFQEEDRKFKAQITRDIRVIRNARLTFPALAATLALVALLAAGFAMVSTASANAALKSQLDAHRVHGH